MNNLFLGARWKHLAPNIAIKDHFLFLPNTKWIS